MALEQKTPPGLVPDFEDGVRCQAVLETVERSAKSKKWEKVRI